MVVGSIPISRSKQAVHCQTRQAKTHPGVYPRVLRADRSPNGPPKEANTVKKFLVIYHAPASAVEQVAGASAEDMQKGMEPWMAWAQRCGDSLVDMGSPLVGGQKIAESGSSPSDRDVAGYSVLQAEDMNAAKALLAGHPHLGWNPNTAIEVHEAMPLPM